jgi:hypothetical protein
MANSFQTVASGVAELKHYYQGPMLDLLSEEIAVYRACEKIKQGWSGDQVNRPLRVRRNQGVGATSDGGNLPKIGNQTTIQATILAKYNYLRFGITGPMIKASASDIGSFVRSAQFELDSGYKDLKTEINRQLCYNGSGSLAVVNTASVSSNTLVLKGRTSGEAALKYVDVGTTFDVLAGSETGAVSFSQVTVSSISTGTAISSTATVILDQNITCSAGDVLIRAGSNTNEIQGLLYSMDGGTTTIYSVDRSKYISYQGNYVDATTLPSTILNLDMMQNPFNAALQRGNVGKLNALYTGFATLRYYQKLLTPDKRYANSTEGDGSFGSKGQFYLDFNGIPVVADKDMPETILYLPQEVMKMYELAAMEFADETGSMYIAQSDVDSLEVRIRHFTNFFNEGPAACGRLDKYTSP